MKLRCHTFKMMYADTRKRANGKATQQMSQEINNEIVTITDQTSQYAVRDEAWSWLDERWTCGGAGQSCRYCGRLMATVPMCLELEDALCRCGS
jgi:hypothetical protein